MQPVSFTRPGRVRTAELTLRHTRVCRCSGVRARAPAANRIALPCRPGQAPAAAAVAVPVSQLSESERTSLAKEWGYKSIGAELPDSVTLADIVKSMPPEVFQISQAKAWGGVLKSLLSVAASLYLISVCPWYLLPFAWFISGTTLTGLFIIGHDCGHRSFSENKLLGDIVGTLALMPLLYPYEPWRVKHNEHHANTNKLVDDTAWHPVLSSEMAKWGPTRRSFFKFLLGSPLKLWGTALHQAHHFDLHTTLISPANHFDLNTYTSKQRPRVLVSMAVVAAFAFLALPALTYYTGFTGLAKYWLMPWLGYHFWMSTFTLVHHTAPHIPFKPAEEWNAAKAQLSGTVDCQYPRWVEFVCHDINVHVPHHVSARIPWYNLRAANKSLQANWGQYMTSCTFNWRMMKAIITELHVYDKASHYVPFDAAKPELFLEVQRKVIPNTP